MGKTIYLFFLFTSMILSQTKQPQNNQVINLLILILPGVLVGILVGYFTNKFNSKTQLEHYKRTSKDDEIDKWILEIKNFYSIIMSECGIFNDLTINLQYNSDNYHDFDKQMDILDKFKQKVGTQLYLLKLFLDDTGKENELYDAFSEYFGILYSLGADTFRKLNFEEMLVLLEEELSEKTGDIDLPKEISNTKAKILKYDNLIKESEGKPNKCLATITALTKFIINEKKKEKSTVK